MGSLCEGHTFRADDSSLGLRPLALFNSHKTATIGRPRFRLRSYLYCSLLRSKRTSFKLESFSLVLPQASNFKGKLWSELVGEPASLLRPIILID